MFIGDMYILRLMVYVQKIEEEKVKDREDYRNKKDKSGNETSQQKRGSSRP